MQVWQSFLNGYFNKSGARRVPQVDSLRGVAALLIFFVHYHALMSHWLVAGSGAASFAKLLESIAHSGTDLFFTLSGYLIYGSLMRREQRIGPYLLRRFGRIYPTFLFVVGGLCLYVELHTMTGFFAILSAVCFAILFWSRFLGGTAG